MTLHPLVVAMSFCEESDENLLTVLMEDWSLDMESKATKRRRKAREMRRTFL